MMQSSKLMVTASTVKAYLDRPNRSPKVLLRVVKVLLHNEGKVLDTYAVLRQRLGAKYHLATSWTPEPHDRARNTCPPDCSPWYSAASQCISCLLCVFPTQTWIEVSHMSSIHRGQPGTLRTFLSSENPSAEIWTSPPPTIASCRPCSTPAAHWIWNGSSSDI